MLASRKVLMTLLGVVICVVLYFVGAGWKLIISVASLFGLEVVAHTITDIISIMRGLQKRGG